MFDFGLKASNAADSAPHHAIPSQDCAQLEWVRRGLFMNSMYGDYAFARSRDDYLHRWDFVGTAAVDNEFLRLVLRLHF